MEQTAQSDGLQRIFARDGLVPSRRALTGALAVRLRELLCFDGLLGTFKTGGDKPLPYCGCGTILM